MFPITVNADTKRGAQNENRGAAVHFPHDTDRLEGFILFAVELKILASKF